MLKQLIQRLLDSRTTPEEAGHSAMPTTTEITSQSFAGPFSSWGPVASGTASEDGYIYAAGAVATSGSNSEFRLDNGQFGSYITSTWGTQGLLLPVMKGQFWRLYAANRKDVVIRLYRLVGGGYKGFIRRALSCLRPSFNYLPRSFSRVNGKQSKHGIFQKSETRLHSHQRQGKTLFTRLQRTDTFKSSCETARRAKNSPSLCTQEEMKTAVQGRNSKILMDGFLYIYPFSRVKLSRFSAQELSQTLSLRSIRTTNPQTGGALC